MSNKLLFRLAVLVTAVMCALGAAAAEAYACYTSSNYTLTFYYDNQRSSRSGTTYDLNTGYNEPSWVTDGINRNVEKVVFNSSFAGARPTTTYCWFSVMDLLRSIQGMNYLNTSEVTNMANMFFSCAHLTYIDVSHFNTSKVTDMSYMFSSCLNLTSLDVSGFNTSRVTNMAHMFTNCVVLGELDLGSFYTFNVANMAEMFAASGMRTIYVGNGWSTAAVTNSSDMFNGCTSLVGCQGTAYSSSHTDKAYAHIDGGPSNPGYFTNSNVPLPPVLPVPYACYTPSNTTLTFYYDTDRSSRPGTTYSMNTGDNDTGWDTDGTNANVTKVAFDPSFANARPTTTHKWFYNMVNLQSITGINYLNTSEVIDMVSMFYGCSALTSLDLSSFNTSKVTSMSNMFKDCWGLTSLDLSSFNTSKVTDMYQMFFRTYELQSIYVGSGWSTAAVTESSYMFYDCFSLVGGQGTAYSSSHTDKAYAHIDGGPSNPGYFTAPGSPDPPVAYTCYTPSNHTLTFYYDTDRSSRPGSTYGLNTGNGDPLWYSDSTYRSVTQVVFNPSFANARPTTTYRWFYNMVNLQSITGINYLNTSEVTDMGNMFDGCSALTSLDLSSFNTSQVTEMTGMFFGCSALTSLDLSSFNTSNVSSMFATFYGCSALTSLDLSNFNTEKVKRMDSMFENCYSLRSIYVGSGWSTEAVISSFLMFWNCTSIVGGMGTTYTDAQVGAAYAHIDGGPSNPGYFTAADSPDPPVPYACYTPSNTTLTFYFDTERSSRTGTTYDLNMGTGEPGWYTDGTNANVTKVVFDPSFAGARPSTTYRWFYRMNNLASITGMEYLNTSVVTNMTYMFAYTNLTSLDLSHFNTSNVNDMYNMFNNCSSLTSLDLSSFNTSYVHHMDEMFRGCSSLTSLDLSNFNTSRVYDMHGMFRGCSSLTSLDLSSFNTFNVADMHDMFRGCSSLTSLDLSSFNTFDVTNMQEMFYNSYHLQIITVGNDWSTAAVTKSTDMFYNCTSLVGDQGTTWNSSNPTDKTYAHFDGGPSNPGYLSEWKEAYACYSGGSGTLTFYCDNQRADRWDPTYDLNTGAATPGWVADGTFARVSRVIFDPSFAHARPTSTFSWFKGMQLLAVIRDISYLNTSEVTNMGYMFYYCNKLPSLDVSSFNTGKVRTMEAMFAGCTNLTDLDVSNFNTALVTDMDGMFYDCSGLTNLELGSFNTNSAIFMSNMFGSCSNLIRLDLSSFNTSRVTTIDLMFSNCQSLHTIYVGSGWTTANVTDSQNMFNGCSNLVGGKGTTWNNSNPTDKTYAHIDGGTANPGYFTDINAARAYACYTPSNNTLTFYYDTEFGTRQGTSYNLNVGNENPAWTSDGSVLSATNVVFDPSFANARPTSTYDWFGEMEGVVSFTGIRYLNTSEVTNMALMFYGCTGLRSLDLSGFNTSKVTDMNSMFNHCNSLTSLDLSSFNTARVTDMSMMFQTCLNLVTIYVGSGWSTAAVTSSDNMFYDSRRIVGGQGTTYNSNHIDKTYAHIDGGTSNPGYFTDVQIAMQPYVALSGDGTTLTFYKDGKIATHTEPTFMLNEPDQTPGWSIYRNVTTVVFDPSFVPVRPTYMGDWFDGLRYLTSIQGLENLNTSEVTSMKNLFNGCTSLVNLDLRYFETGNVTDMNSMFRDCSSLRQLDLPSFDTRKVTEMNSMFRDCSSMSQLDLSSFDTRKVTDMNGMFRGCTSLESLDLSSFDTHSVTRMIWMFYNCSNLTTIYAGSNWDTAGVTSSSSMFANCTSLVGGHGTAYNDANPKDKTYAHIDGGTSNPGYFTRDPNSPEPYACYTPSNTTLTFYYDNQRDTRPGTTFSINEGMVDPEWYEEGYSYDGVTKVVFDPSFASARPTSTYHWFAEMYDLTSIEGMQYLNTSEVTNMASMFWECGALPAVDVSGFDTRNVTDMSAMFAECYELTALDVSGWNTSYVTDMSWMFSNCSELTSLDVSHFNTSNVTNMRQLFDGCSGLTSLDVSNFDTSNVTDMSSMFGWCNGLQQLDLSGFNTSKVTNMSSMFNECETLRTIYVGDSWTTAAVTSSSYMFDVCHSLVGGKGTTYSSSNPKDKTYAHIDGGTSNPGYFSEKGGTFLRGDVNGDGSVNISDVTALIDYLLTGNASGINLSGADCNQDSSVNISDVTSLIDYLLAGSW